jgi:hypothetical protein
MNDEPIMLSQPLMTEDGFVNPACMNELEAELTGLGKTYERLKDDPEWSKKKDQWTFKHQIVGCLAMWACRQSPYGVPEGLESVCKYLNASLNSYGFDKAEMIELSLCDISRMLYEVLYEQGIKPFDAWNVSKIAGPPIHFSCRFSAKDPDRDFIDLDALLHNVCISIRNERRTNNEFDRKFDADHPEFKNSSPNPEKEQDKL